MYIYIYIYIFIIYYILLYATLVANFKPITGILEPLPPGTLIPFVMTMKSGKPDIGEKFSDSLILRQKEDGFERFLDCLHSWISKPNITSSYEALHAGGLKSVLDFLCSCISKFCYNRLLSGISCPLFYSLVSQYGLRLLGTLRIRIIQLQY